MKNKNTYKAGGSNPLKKINNTMSEKRGKALGSMLEGGRIVYGDDKKKKKKKKKDPMPGTISNVNLKKAGKKFGNYWNQFKTIMKTPIIK